MKLPFELPLIPAQYQVFLLATVIVSVGFTLFGQMMNALARRYKACPSCQFSMPRATEVCPKCGTKQP